MRAEFAQALAVLARISEEMVRRGHPRPILVGGGALELYSASAYVTGDFDLVADRQDVLEEVFRQFGFVRPSGAGQLLRGWIHPELSFGFEIVGDRLLDGFADMDRLFLLDVGADGATRIIGIEDLIADRMGQYASGAARECLDQARQLRKLVHELDEDYMGRRISEETMGAYGLDALDD